MGYVGILLLTIFVSLDRADSFISKPTDDIVVREKDRLLMFCTTRSMKRLLGGTGHS
jgi:hypothetical protein